MRKLVYYVGVSLDGYIAGPADQWDFFPVSPDMSWITEQYPEFVPADFREQAGIAADAPNTRFDTVLMGRRTYDAGLPVTDPYPHLCQYVVSRGFRAAPDPAVRLVRDDPAEFVRGLKGQEGGDIWLCGGGVLAAALLGEIDELILKSYPVVVGAGMPMVAGGFRPGQFRPVRRRQFDSGAQISWFTRA
ncbi:dihydrofolate reductase family protein [Nocardia farcinica]|uniref:dihydrofolate reductase family protein n=1 Tax=Nocardia farcinica TaxID=37329 RepID=UPI000DFB99AB|nr:dihydrofolate reductase family protein [Nocardia farcinica]SUE31232.1 dihydrofolate reductase [Nocardia farcinica]